MSLSDVLRARYGDDVPEQVQQARPPDSTNPGAEDELPAYPHPDEPAETPAEHAIERTMGHEIKPENPYDKFGRLARREMPAHMMSMQIPNVTRAAYLMNRQLPARMTTPIPPVVRAPLPSRQAPPAAEIRLLDNLLPSMPQVTAAAGSRLDPFKGLGRCPNFSRKKKLPRSMNPSFRKGKTTRKGWS